VTVSDIQTEKWAPIPGAGYYQASDQGRVRSIDRTIGTRFYPSTVLKPREDGDGYLVVNITYDSGERKHGVSVARLVLLAHDPDGRRPGLQACHGPGGQKDNRVANLRWDTDEANRADWRRDNPPQPKPPKQCVICTAEFEGNGRRCHPCVVGTGAEAAKLLQGGMALKAVTERLGYPVTVDGLDGIVTLARRYGGYGLPWSRRVMARWRAWLAGGDAA
jgi:NUMOD4 motif